jgi:catechol 2,3-dioxygenase-like lactoylglutathione lyase family enzyme
MLDHIGFAVRDYDRSKAFYLKVLKPLGYSLIMELSAEQTGGKSHAGFGPEGQPQFWIGTGEPITGQMHVAFAAKSRKAVDAFYRAALDAGGIDNGAPGLRPHYHENYYGAFVLDPDGLNVEAVCHLPK